MPAVTSDRILEPKPGSHAAPHERDVLLLDFAVVELPRQFAVSAVMLRDHHHSGRPAIETMDDPGPLHAADPAEAGDMMEQRVDERAARMPGRRMHDHAGRLVDDGDVGIV